MTFRMQTQGGFRGLALGFCLCLFSACGLEDTTVEGGEKNLEEFLARVEKDQGQVVFFAMSVPDYELMAYNTQELKRYIRELKEVVIYYREVTTNEASTD